MPPSHLSTLFLPSSSVLWSISQSPSAQPSKPAEGLKSMVVVSQYHSSVLPGAPGWCPPTWGERGKQGAANITPACLPAQLQMARKCHWGDPYHCQGQVEHAELLRAPPQPPEGTAVQCPSHIPVTSRSRAEWQHEWPVPVSPCKDDIHPGRLGGFRVCPGGWEGCLQDT